MQASYSSLGNVHAPLPSACQSLPFPSGATLKKIFFPLQTCELLGKQCPKVGEKLQGSVVPELEGMGEAAKLNCLGLVTEAAINI